MVHLGHKEHRCHLIFPLMSIHFQSMNVYRYLTEWQCDDDAQISSPVYFRDVFRGRAWRRWRDVAGPKELQTFTAQESSCPDISYRSRGFTRLYPDTWSNFLAHIMINKLKDLRLRETGVPLVLKYRGFSILCTKFDQSHSIKWPETCRRIPNHHGLDLNKQTYAKFLLRTHKCQVHTIFTCKIEIKLL